MLHSIVLIVLSIMMFAFVVSIIFKRNDVVDFFWGFGFIAIAVSSLSLGGVHHWTQWLVTGLVVIWGTRLCSHIFVRLVESNYEDKRYAAWRKEWMAEAPGYFYTRSLLQIFLFQGLLMMLVMTPVILFNASNDAVFSPMVIVGLLVWLFGFVFEAVADHQLDHYLKQAKRPRVLKTGLWQYSRHPNYFGEVMQWWGIWLMTIMTVTGWLGILGPITITALILYVSGIPLLEERFKDSKTYQKYKMETSAFIPLPPFK
jgi:steroid 5-alpha reductase family enzyme